MRVFIGEGLNQNPFCTHCLVFPCKSDISRCAEHVMALCCCSVFVQCCDLSLQIKFSQAASHEALPSQAASHEAVLGQAASHEAVLRQAASHVSSCES